MKLNNAIVITGAGQRLGFALAKRLHTLETPVLITFRTAHEQINELRAIGVDCIQCDFSNQIGIDSLTNHINKHYHSIKALIHNASQWESEQTTEDFNGLLNKMMQIHVNTPYLLNLALAEKLQRNYDDTKTSANIIHFTDHIVSSGSKKHIAYAASKAALDNLTLSFAAKLAPKIKVNSIAPALLMFNQHDGEEYKAKALKKSLMQLEPGEIEGIKAVEYLLSSQYVTGHILQVNGGRHLV